MTDESLLKPYDDQQLEITKLNGRTQIVFKKALLKGKVTSADVLNTILIAARLQTEKYIEKLSRGTALDSSEIKALRDLAEITKLHVPEFKETKQESVDLASVKATLYSALTEKLKEK